MDLNIILCFAIIALLLVIIVLIISLKKSSDNTDSLRREISTMLMQTREELQNNLG